MKFIILLVVITFSVGTILPQNILIKINNLNDSKLLVYSLQGEKLIPIDSVFTDNKGEINFLLKDNHPGFYRLIFTNNKFLDFVYDDEEIEIETDENNNFDNINILTSESNKIYYEFVMLNKAYKTTTELLQLILARYPKDDDYYETTKTKLSQIQEDYLNFVNITAQTNPKSFIARYVKSAQLPSVDTEILFENQFTFLKSNALDNVNFDDAELIYSDVFTNKSIEYLTYYRNPQLPKELLEKEFMKAVDSLLNKAKVNQLVYQHITDYLIDGFKKFGFDKLIDYIIENYVIEDDLCLDEETENSIQKRIDQSKLLWVGTKVPNIVMPDIDGKVVELSEIKSAKTLVVFYSSQCPNCKTLLPKLNEMKKQENEFTIIAVSLDTKIEDWIKFVKENQLELININDPNGWDGHLASSYYIYATPTMFLLDSEKNIIGKPINYEELQSY